jgi:hypothetical protein
MAATLVLVAPPQLRAESDGWSWQSIRGQVENFVHNSFRSRARLIQVSAVAVAIGIFIMFRAPLGDAS